MSLKIIVMVLMVNTLHCYGENLPEVQLPKLAKCCALNQYVGVVGRNRKVCMDRNPVDNTTDFSRIYSGIDVTKVFNVTENKFSDVVFHAECLNTKALSKLKIFLSTNGALYMDLPHAYNRLVKIDNFCIDIYRDKFNKTSQSFWLIQHTETQDKNDNFLTGAMFVSSGFLLVVLIVYGLLPELRNLCGCILMAYVASLLIAFLHLAIIRMKKHTDTICFGLTLVVYYSFLASFCWMTVMSYDIWWTFRGYAKARPIHRRGTTFKFLMYCIYAWGLPLGLTIFLALINGAKLDDKPWFIKPNLPSVGCFIEGGEKFLYLYIPMLILICTNWMFYLMTAFNIWRLSRGTAVLDSAAAGTPAAHRTHRHRFLVYLKLSVVMGLNWVLEVISFLVPDFKGWVITDAYNIFIGVAIFLIFVCKKKILRKLKKLHIRRASKANWYASSSTRSNSASDSSQETQTLQICANPKGPGYIVNDF